MYYQSKKDENITVKLVEKIADKYRLEYVSGDKAGEKILVGESTLKRWWKKVEESAPVKDTEPEVFEVEIEDAETHKLKKVKITSDMGVDEASVSGYNFNPPEEDKHYVEMPDSVKQLATDYVFEHVLASGEKFPEVEELVDKCVEWGATVKRFGGFITLEDKTKILFRRNKSTPKKSLLEVRMVEDVSKKVKSFEVTNEPLKSAMCKGVDFVARCGSMKEIETLIREISA